MKIRKLLSTMALSAIVASNALATEPVKVEWGDPVKQPWGDPSDPEGTNVCSWFQWGQDLWFDYNNDGYMDRFVIGGKHEDLGHAYLFRNEEGGELTNIPVDIPKLEIAGAVVLDFDNDGIMDLYVQGKRATDNGRENYTAIWRGTGDPENPFEHAVQQEIDELGIGESEGQHRGYFCAAGDYDNDGWTDLFMTGWARKDESWHVILYRNNQGTFEEVQNPVGEDGEGIEPFKTITTGSIYLSDLNKDGYLDLIVSGNDQTNGWVATTTIYFNNGDGTFRETTQQGFFEGQKSGTTFTADVNNDGYPDILEFGDFKNSETETQNTIGNLYINNGDGTFAEPLKTEVTQLLTARAVPAVGDINNDGKIDIMIQCGWSSTDGQTETEYSLTNLYYNNGDNSFTREYLNDNVNSHESDVNFVDFNHDGALDYSISGWGPKEPNWFNRVVPNNLTSDLAMNEAPKFVNDADVQVKEEDSDVIIFWGSATDDTTPAEAIRYNIYIKAKKADEFGTTYTYTYVPANIETNLQLGNTTYDSKVSARLINGQQIRMKGFNTTDYEFAVQPVDNGNLGGKFVVASSKGTGIKQAQVANAKVYAANGKIIIESDVCADYTIITTDGKLVANGTCNQKADETVNNGIYIVKVADAMHKVCVLP